MLGKLKRVVIIIIIIIIIIIFIIIIIIIIIIIMQRVKKAADIGEFLELSFNGLGYFWPRYGEYSQITCLLTCLTCFCFSMKSRHVCQGMFVDVKVPSYWLCLLFFQERTGLISLSDWSWRLLLHGDVWLLNSISRNDRSGKITSFFCIVCSFCAFLVKRWWMQLNTDHTKACLLKYFILDICQNVGFVCFRMCWRILITLLLQLAVVEVHQE